jgi:hypothetical protein
LIRYYHTVPKLLVKVNSVNEGEHKAKVTMLDIDDYGSIVPLDELELKLPLNDSSIIHILESSPYAAIFTEGNFINKDATIILANGITVDELNMEKNKTIERKKNR